MRGDPFNVTVVGNNSGSQLPGSTSKSLLLYYTNMLETWVGYIPE